MWGSLSVSAWRSYTDESGSSDPLNSAKTMKRKSKDPLYTALMLQATGRVDVTFAGLTHSTGDVYMGSFDLRFIVLALLSG